MSLTMVTIVPASGEAVELPIGSSIGYQLEEIEGLDPVKATIASSNFGWADGASYQSSRRDVRNIVMKVGYVPDYVANTVQSLRLGLARRMMPKSPVTLRFHDSDGSVVRISGRVESFDSPLFVQDPRAIISIMCFDPDFVSETELTKTGQTVSDLTDSTVEYEGPVATGFLFEMTMPRATNEIALVARTADGETKRMDFAMALASGDKLEINSVFGNKGVWVTQGGSRTTALYATTPESNFLTLASGANTFRVQMPGTPIPYTIKYFPRYGSL